MSFKQKYLKYKAKYLKLKNQIGGDLKTDIRAAIQDFTKKIDIILQKDDMTPNMTTDMKPNVTPNMTTVMKANMTTDVKDNMIADMTADMKANMIADMNAVILKFSKESGFDSLENFIKFMINVNYNLKYESDYDNKGINNPMIIETYVVRVIGNRHYLYLDCRPRLLTDTMEALIVKANVSSSVLIDNENDKNYVRLFEYQTYD